LYFPFCIGDTRFLERKLRKELRLRRQQEAIAANELLRNFLRKKSEHPFKTRANRDTVYLVQTSMGITLEAFSLTRSALFLRKDRNLRPAFAEAIVPKTRAHGVRYARGFGEPLKIYHGFSFFFL
jgi:hypothetical protein